MNTQVLSRLAQCYPPVLLRCLGHPWCLGLLVVSRAPECLGHLPPQGRRRRRPPLNKALDRRDNHTTRTITHNHSTKQHNATNNIPQHNTTTTQPPTITAARVAVHTIPHHRLCLPFRFLILVCCLLPLVSVSVLSLLPRFCLFARLSVCLDVRLFVRMSVSVCLFCLSVTVILRRSLCKSTFVWFSQRW